MIIFMSFSNNGPLQNPLIYLPKQYVFLPEDIVDLVDDKFWGMDTRRTV